MNIQIRVQHQRPVHPLFVTMQIGIISKTIDLSSDHQIIDADLALDSNHNQTVTIAFNTKDPNIIAFPLEITSIILDEFYERKEFIYRGRPEYDQLFLTHCQKNNIVLDHSVCDCSTFNFTGRLTFNFFWPFWRNLSGRP